MKTFSILNRGIGLGRTFVIAEIGSNHGGDLSAAKEHIDAAAEAGADAVKFQSLNLQRLWHDPLPAIKALHARIDLPEEWHAELQEYSRNRGVIFSSSPTYLEAVDLLNQLQVPFFKIASAQIGTFPQLVKAVAASGKPTFFSTGIVGYSTIAEAVQIFNDESNPNFGIFHCNSMYPTPSELVYLGRMATYRSMFQCPVGFSDHTDGSAVVLAAVALGADMIEKHFRLEDIDETPDAAFSLPPDAFNRMVNDIRSVEPARADSPRVELESSEEDFRESIRYRLILRRDKSEGNSLSPADFDYLRSSEGIDVAREELVCSHFVPAGSIKAGSVLQWSDLRGAL